MFVAQPSVTEIVSAITRSGIKKGDVAAIMLGEKSNLDVEQLIATLNQQGIEFFGGIFPGVIIDNHHYDDGAIVMVFPSLKSPFIVDTRSEHFVFSEVKDLIEKQSQKYTAVILVDALAKNVATLMSEFFNQIGSSVSYIGGGAGSLSLKQTPCVFTSAGVVQDAAVIALVKLQSNVRARHGWEQVMGPIVATKTRNNLIVELNWRNAFEVYRSIVEEDSGKVLTHENFFDIVKGYPFGLHREGAEDIVRDPVGFTETGELVFVVDIPENAVFNLLRGNADSIIQAAGKAAEECQSPTRRQGHTNFVVDCISRVMYLGENFHQELQQVKDKIATTWGTLIPEGILSLGEIAPDEEDVLQLYNKTIVVGVFYE